MKNAPYSLETDGSNDNGLKKINPLTVQIYDVNLKWVKTTFLDMCLSSGSTTEMLFQGTAEHALEKTNVNLGKNNSILMRVKLQNPSVYFNGCQCHGVQNTSLARACNEAAN